MCICGCLCLEGKVSRSLPDSPGVPVTNIASLSLAEVTRRRSSRLLPQSPKARLLKRKERTGTTFSHPKQSMFLAAAGGDGTQAGLCGTKAPFLPSVTRCRSRRCPEAIMANLANYVQRLRHGTGGKNEEKKLGTQYRQNVGMK